MSARARGLVILILDTLRADYESFCRELDIPLTHFPHLRALCSETPAARCGSFPTGPMRTDLLTGRLAFLSGEWALPQPGEETLVSRCRKLGFWTSLVTDNYVATIPRLGGMLIDEFDTVEFIRGAGSDPWITPSPEILAAAREMARERPTRNPLFEAQFIANSRRWPGGVPPFRRVFEAACDHLRELVRHDRFLLWVDTFACHEPWVGASEFDSGQFPEESLFPGYVEEGLYSREHLARLRWRFAERIGETDQALGPFVDELKDAMHGGDVALAVLSDHGFLFGEFGFVGKPANTPLPPELHEILCWTSGHFGDRIPGEPWLQPHVLHRILRNGLGVDGNGTTASGLQVFARNSPRSNYLTAAAGNDLFILEKVPNEPGAQLRTVERHRMDRGLPLREQGETAIPGPVRESLRAILSGGSSPWLDEFRKALE